MSNLAYFDMLLLDDNVDIFPQIFIGIDPFIKVILSHAMFDTFPEIYEIDNAELGKRAEKAQDVFLRAHLRLAASFDTAPVDYVGPRLEDYADLKCSEDIKAASVRDDTYTNIVINCEYIEADGAWNGGIAIIKTLKTNVEHVLASIWSETHRSIDAELYEKMVAAYGK